MEQSFAAQEAYGEVLATLAGPLPEGDISRLEALLERLLRLEDAHIIPVWETDLPAPARAMTLLDLDGDQRAELLAVSNNGDISLYRLPEGAEEERGWQAWTNGQLPPDAGPIIGVQTSDTLAGYLPAVHILTGGRNNASDRFYELFITPDAEIDLRPAPPNRSGYRRLAIGRHFGDLETIDDLAHLWVSVSPEADIIMRGQSHRRTMGEIPLNFRPTAVVHTGRRVWAGDNQERVHSWRWVKGEFHLEGVWPVNGRVTALALWPAGKGWLTLAAADERRLILIDDQGQVVADRPLPQVAAALVPWPERQLLWIAFVDGRLSLCRPMLPPFLPANWPSVSDLLNKLSVAEQADALQRWRQEDRAPLVGALLAEQIAQLTGVDRQAAKELAHLGQTEKGVCLANAAIRALDILEPRALAQEEADHPLVQNSLAWAWALYPQCPLELRRRLDVFTGRLAAHFGALLSHNRDYRRLNEARQQGDRRLARQYLDKANQKEATLDRKRSSFSLYSEMLIQRRQTAWIFAAKESIRAIMTLPDTPHTLLATKGGELFQLDLAQKNRYIAQPWPLLPGDIPCGLVLGPNDEAGSQVVALLTVQGHLYMAPAQPERCLSELKAVHQVGRDAWSLALLAPTPGAPPRLIVGCDGGSLLYHDYDSQEEGWRLVDEIALEAEWLHTLVADALIEGDPPVILAGGAQAGGRGVLHLLDFDGRRRHDPHLFPGPVLDARLVDWSPGEPKAIAVACADGYLYLMHPQGFRLWRYQVGRAARSLAVFDIDDDGQEEIIVGGEAQENMVIILDLQGAIQWHIPTRAPVTHVVAARLAGNRAQLLIVDLDRILQVVEVHPPDSWEEEAVKREAADCLALIAARDGVSPAALVERWLTAEAPRPAWRCYAFYDAADRALAGQPDALAQLSAVNVAAAEATVQRAYGRALVNVATLARDHPQVVKAAIKRLRELLAAPETRQEVGLAAVCKLALPGRLAGHQLETWLPLLQTAAANPLAEVRRAALYALRRLLLNEENGVEAPVAVWSLFRDALAGKSDNDAWLVEEIACLAREIAGDFAALWVAANRHLAHLKQGAVLQALGRVEYPLLDSPDKARAINGLRRLWQATDFDSVGEALQELAARLKRINFDKLPAANRLVEWYQLLIQAAALEDKAAWEQFVSVHPASGLDRLAMLLAEESRQPQAGPYLDAPLRQVEQLQQTIRRFQGQSAPDALQRLIGELEQRGEQMAGLAQEKLPLQNGGQAFYLILTQALAGLLRLWSHPEGVLSQWLDEMNRLVEPRLELIAADLRRDELLLEAALWNPSQSQPIEDVRVRIPQARLAGDGWKLSCHSDSTLFAQELVLDPQTRHSFRLRVFLDNPSAQAEIDRAVQQNQAMRLYLPVHYFLPAKGYVNETLEVPVQVRAASYAALDWEEDLPHTWRQLRQALHRAVHAPESRPLLIQCTPLAREKLIQALHRMITGGPPLPVVDACQWFFTYRQMDMDEASFLAWLAERFWPEAADRADAIRFEGAPQYHFRKLAQAMPRYKAIILTNWERLLVSVGRHEQWTALDQALPFLLNWAEGEGVRLIFVGTYLAEQMGRQRWPEMAGRLRIVRCDHVGLASKESREELVAAFERILKERDLLAALKRFDPPVAPAELVRFCGGYLHILEFVALQGLAALQQEPTLRPESLERYLVQYAYQSNFFNNLWLWQNFFERLAIVLAAHGEIPVQERAWIEEGVTLAQDYHARQPDGRPSSRPTLTAGVTLDQKRATTIKANIHYRRGDAVIGGFDPDRPPPAEWGAAGKLFLQLLKAGGGRALLDRLVESKVLRRHATARLGSFYELAVPAYAGWIRRAGIWKQMRAAAQTGLDSWYPAELVFDQRPESGGNRQLFPGRKAGAAHKDIALAALPAVEKALDQTTLPLFLNLFGLSSRGVVDIQQRWRALVGLAGALQEWGQLPPAASGEGEVVRRLFEALQALLYFRPVPGGEPDGGWPHLAAAQRGEYLLPWAYVELDSHSQTLRKQLLLLVIRDGDQVARDADDLRNWAKERLRAIYPDASGEEWREIQERSVAVALSLTKSDALKRRPPPGGAGPHFVFVDISALLDMVVQPNPVKALMGIAFQTIGRRSFAPYKLVGSLAGGSPLFVGRENELNTILNSLDREDHAILGSRRIGKTSLLQGIEHRLRQAAPDIPVFLLRLSAPYAVDNFYGDFKYALKKAGHAHLAGRLAGKPEHDYQDLREVMEELRERHNHPVILLLDEIDGLYLWDQGQNQERLFQFWRNNLAQATPRLCTFVMTGYRHIYLSRFSHDSAFFNFCRFHNLAGVDREGVRRLVRLLRDLELELDDEEEVIGLIEHDTYAIPYFVQLVCDRLLHLVDRYKLQRVGPGDARQVLEQDVRRRLRTELWDQLSVDVLPTAAGAPSIGQQDLLKTKIILLATMITLYQEQFQSQYARAPRLGETPTFTAMQARQYLQELYPDAWDVTEEEIKRLLNALSMTLALAPAEEERDAYKFPDDILPDVLFYYEREGELQLIDELERMVRELQALGTL